MINSRDPGQCTEVLYSDTTLPHQLPIGDTLVTGLGSVTIKQDTDNTATAFSLI